MRNLFLQAGRPPLCHCPARHIYHDAFRTSSAEQGGGASYIMAHNASQRKYGVLIYAVFSEDKAPLMRFVDQG